MVIAIQCSQEADHHNGTLRKDGIGYICQECWAGRQGIELKKSQGRPLICPNCGETLMTRYRGGRVSISSMNMKGNTATLTCDCGYKKTVKNPFGQPQGRDKVLQLARATGKGKQG